MREPASKMSDDEAPPPPPLAHHVAVKPPPFTGNSVRRWFTVLEAQFTLARITNDATKCTHVFSCIPVEVLDKLTDDVISENNYAALKDNIINLYTKPQPQQFNELLHCTVLATKPTLYLQQLRSHAASFNLPDNYLKIQFINAMPPAIKANLVTHPGSLDDIAKVADTLMAYNYSNPPDYPYAPKMPAMSVNDHNSFHVRANDQPSHQYRTNSRSSSSYQNYSNPKQFDYSDISIPHNIRAFNEKQRPNVCRYHIYYGKQAKRCKRWCLLNNPNITTLPDSRPPSRSASPNRLPNQGNLMSNS